MKSILSFLSIVLVFTSCKTEIEKSGLINNTTQISNVLNFNGTPKTAFDKKMLMFSDQGAWFAYSFPDTISNFGGFSGPFLMTQQNGVWSSANLSQLVLKDVNWKSIETNSYASHLEQIFKSDSLELKQQLVFSSGHTALIKSEITNISNKEAELSIHWKNQPILAEGIEITSSKNEVIIKSTKTNAIGHLLFPKGTSIKNTDSTYSTELENISLKPNQVKEITISQTFIFTEYSWEKEKESLLATSFDSVLTIRKLEKEAQFLSLKNNLKSQFKDSIYQQVLAKSLVTLQNNWRIAAGELKYEGLFPSYHYEWFHGFWSWDSWKHAVGLSYFNTNLAKNQMRALFDFQKEDGFIVDCIYRNTSIEPHNYRDTKPPLSAWAVEKIYEIDKDLEFVKEMYPKLKKYHNWWYNKRDHDKDGLCEYGSTDGSLIAAKWESGMDNAIRFDDSKILKNGDGAYSLNQESVDLNAYLYAEKKYLILLAEALNLTEDAKTYKKEAALLKTNIQQQFYDTKDGWFYDTNLEGTVFIKGEGSEGWTALWANAATHEQAEAVKNKMMNPLKFYTKVPFQTMSADHSKFDPLNGYWRGPNWLDQAYFGVKGLRNYGFNVEADKVTVQILNGAEGILGKGKSIRENYHPVTGEGLNAENFSWSAAHIIMLLTD
ncbi:MGH1-like glycoside hydrolase domain-containing protein [Lutibacter maritimus]|uniref:Putative isomerase n=1 Tax=Lutibacter maritimus TaxID=593133 RepID=A0A1I6Q9D1_9FLAO|nr:trehalase family glycosidase [Lutibacter maritimus]SFS49069.1 putative isomerase [Lutibacter maritimus]